MIKTSISFSDTLAQIRQELLNHPLYLSLNSKKALRIFMEQHVYAVWIL